MRFAQPFLRVEATSRMALGPPLLLVSAQRARRKPESRAI